MLNQSPSLDLMFQALSDPSRRVMVERLSRGPASVSELARPLAMSLPAVVQHLQVLEASGLVQSEKVGRVRTCHLEPAAKAHWFVGPDEWESSDHELDFRVGGREHVSGGPKDGPIYSYDALYQD